MKRTLLKITLLAAFEPERLEFLDVASLGDAAAELLRDHGALTVASEYDDVEADVADGEDSDELGEALVQHFPTDVLAVGAVPGVKVLGRNGTFKRAALKREGDRIELWLGTEKERYPLVSFKSPLAPADDDCASCGRLAGSNPDCAACKDHRLRGLRV